MGQISLDSLLNLLSSGTALFSFLLPQADDGLSPQVSSFDFGKPVLDFILQKGSDEALIWITLDHGRTSTGSYASEIEKDTVELIKVMTVLPSRKVSTLSGTESPVTYSAISYRWRPQNR